VSWRYGLCDAWLADRHEISSGIAPGTAIGRPAARTGVARPKRARLIKS
jgi:hypothetical protein